MTDEEKEVAAIRMKYRGQCNKIKGHCTEGACLIAGIIIGLVIAVMSNVFQYSTWERWGVRNGYASYDRFGELKWNKP